MHRYTPGEVRDATQTAIDWEANPLIRARARLHGSLVWFREGCAAGVPKMKVLSDNLDVLKAFALNYGSAKRPRVQALHSHVPYFLIL